MHEQEPNYGFDLGYVGWNGYHANKINNVEKGGIKKEKDIVPEEVTNGAGKAINVPKYYYSGITYAVKGDGLFSS